MNIVILFIVLVISVSMVLYTKTNKEPIIDFLTSKEKIIVGILCLLGPALTVFTETVSRPTYNEVNIWSSPLSSMLTGFILYYGWKRELPSKSKQVAIIAFTVFCIVLSGVIYSGDHYSEVYIVIWYCLEYLKYKTSYFLP